MSTRRNNSEPKDSLARGAEVRGEGDRSSSSSSSLTAPISTSVNYLRTSPQHGLQRRIIAWLTSASDSHEIHPHAVAEIVSDLLRHSRSLIEIHEAIGQASSWHLASAFERDFLEELSLQANEYPAS